MLLGSVVLLLPLCFCVLQVECIAGVEATGIGVNSGTNVGSNSAEDLVQDLRSRGIGKIRLHDADSEMLLAIGNSDSREAPMEVMVGVRNEEIVDLGVSPASAHSWVLSNVVPFCRETNITAIAVGNEVLTSKQVGKNSIVPFLVPAMRNLYNALSEVRLETQIKVSAPQSAQVLSSYFPVSSATFNGDIASRAMTPLLEFLASSGSYFMINLYPLDLQHNGGPLNNFSAEGIHDPETGRHYSSMVDIFTDAVSVAMASLGHHYPISVLGIEMEWTRTSARPASSALVVDIPSEGLAVDSNPNFGKHLRVNPPAERKEIRVPAFSSRRFLGDVLKAHEVGSGKRRRLGPNKSWCVADADASTDALQTALNWACGPGGANCQPIQVGQSCFLPNTIVAHASYAFNSYYQANSALTDSCDFGGLAQITNSDPSTASCLYSSSTSSSGTPSTPTGTTVPSGSPTNSIASRLAWDRCRFILTSLIFVFLIKRSISELKI